MRPRVTPMAIEYVVLAVHDDGTVDHVIGNTHLSMGRN